MVATAAAHDTGLPPKVEPWAAVGPAVHERGAGHDPRQRQPGGDALGEQQHVGRDAEGLGRERAAGATEAALHLVEHQQDAVLVAALSQPGQPREGRHDVAALAEHRLDDHRRQRAGLGGEDLVELGQRGVHGAASVVGAPARGCSRARCAPPAAAVRSPPGRRPWPS